jgi:hypothetical protein
MEAGRQHVQQEAAHELVSHQSHRFVPRVAVGAVVLPTKGNAAIIRGEQPRVGDRDPVGVSGQIREYRLRTCEGALGVDDPLALAKGAKPVGKCLGVSKICAFRPRRTVDPGMTDSLGAKRRKLWV